MEPLTAVAIVAAGAVAGIMNTVVGAGTLVTFPTLLALGWAPVPANISNALGLVVGGITGSWGYRRELAGQRDLLVRLAPLSIGGSVIGALLLLVLPDDAFEAIVPVLIVLSLVLVVTGPAIQRRTAARRAAREEDAGPSPAARAGAAWFGVLAGTFLTAVYGGYFGAAQGVILTALLGVLLAESLQRVNALKNVLSTFVNLVAALTFLVVSPSDIDWAVAGLIAVGSFGGGLAGAVVGRRLPAPVLRTVIVVVGLLAVLRLVTS